MHALHSDEFNSWNPHFNSIQDDAAAIFISLIGLMLPTVLLSGFIYPIENMPKIYDYVSSVLPPRYFIVIIKNIMIKEQVSCISGKRHLF